MKIFRWIWIYLKDWKNLLSHTILGILIVLFAFYMPIKPVFRLIFLFMVVGFNINRMRLEKKRVDTFQDFEE